MRSARPSRLPMRSAAERAAGSGRCLGGSGRAGKSVIAAPHSPTTFRIEQERCRDDTRGPRCDDAGRAGGEPPPGSLGDRLAAAQPAAGDAAGGLSRAAGAGDDRWAHEPLCLRPRADPGGADPPGRQARQGQPHPQGARPRHRRGPSDGRWGALALAAPGRGVGLPAREAARLPAGDDRGGGGDARALAGGLHAARHRPRDDAHHLRHHHRDDAVGRASTGCRQGRTGDLGLSRTVELHGHLQSLRPAGLAALSRPGQGRAPR